MNKLQLFLYKRPALHFFLAAFSVFVFLLPTPSIANPNILLYSAAAWILLLSGAKYIFFAIYDKMLTSDAGNRYSSAEIRRREIFSLRPFLLLPALKIPTAILPVSTGLIFFAVFVIFLFLFSQQISFKTGRPRAVTLLLFAATSLLFFLAPFFLFGALILVKLN